MEENREQHLYGIHPSICTLNNKIAQYNFGNIIYSQDQTTNDPISLKL